MTNHFLHLWSKDESRICLILICGAMWIVTFNSHATNVDKSWRQSKNKIFYYNFYIFLSRFINYCLYCGDYLIINFVNQLINLNRNIDVFGVI